MATKDTKRTKKAAPPVRKPGRPSTYSHAAAERICARIASGETLRAICRDDDMPSWTAVYRWMEARPEFSERIARARELGFDAIAQETLEIADETAHDTVATEQGERPNTEWIARSRLRVETRLKLLAKWDPKRYGDKVQHTGDGGGPIETRNLSDAELNAKIAALSGKAGAGTT